MATWRFKSWAGWAVTAGVLSVCAIPLSLLAGDKIEFSDPAVPLSVPQIEREEIETQKVVTPSDPANEIYQDADMQDGNAGVMVVSVPGKKTGSVLDDENTDETADAANHASSLTADKGPDLDAIEQWRKLRALDPNFGGIYSANRSPEDRETADAGRGSLRSRLEMLDSMQKSPYDRTDEHYGLRSFDRDDAQQSFRNFFHSRTPGLSGMQDGQFTAIYGQSQSAQQPGYGGYNAAASSAANNSWPTATTVTAFTEHNQQKDLRRNPAPDETMTMSALRESQSEQATIVNQNNDTARRRAAMDLRQSENKEIPAVLPFPKRPGSVFQ